jgi:activator of 2-hydroxyglutaryl-CoA dehydratase/predicted nucleotide-binding protein (sugar kinase/HSP70/actin superfamily)
MARTISARKDAVSGADAKLRVPERRDFQSTERFPQGLVIGLDVGSTTVKAVVVDPLRDAVLWKDYQRHETRQPEKCLEFLETIAAAFPGVPEQAFRLFVTGSGSTVIGKLTGGAFVQEVNAVTFAVEKAWPDVRSVIELGGQDAKIIVFKDDPVTGARKRFPSMNDKCAGGTGAVIDKIAAKLGLSPEQLGGMGYEGIRLHNVAGKCGVFAETDINGLQKQGVPAEELMASLFDSLVQQNLSVLTRGHTLLPRVVLLGGPNHYIQGMRECWRQAIPPTWTGHEEAPEDYDPADCITVPDDAQYYAALGAVEHAKTELGEDPNLGVYAGPEHLRWYIGEGRAGAKSRSGQPPLVASAAEREDFLSRHTPPTWSPPAFAPGQEYEAFLGLDGGSTSTKAVLVSPEREVLAKAYQLSRGNPIEDSREVLASLREQVEGAGARLRVLGMATTGYAKDTLGDVFQADAALVETVAHAQSGLHYHPDADVICDVGGQDIKIILMKQGRVSDFRLNTQCSAGNGFYLQSTAEAFGIPVEQYAEVAFQAETMPVFGYGCAVFMQSDIVDFQRKGWERPEILAGLASVLPKNIWLYVCKIPNLAMLGRTFVLQGGTQRNMAAVKAQVDFIRDRFAGSGVEPEVVVHRHCGESGAIGCAFEAQRLYEEAPYETRFIGFEAAARIAYRSTRVEKTRCNFCKNGCMRTFLDYRIDGQPLTQLPDEAGWGWKGNKPPKTGRRVPLAEGERRVIISTCEKGAVEDVNEMRSVKSGLEATAKANPDLAEFSLKEAFKPPQVEDLSDRMPMLGRWPGRKRRVARRQRMMRREEIRVGIPRVLNLYNLAPYFSAWFQALGVPAENIVYSDVTSQELYRKGSRRGSIDPCFPSKLTIPHVHNLLFEKHKKKPLTHIFFPMIASVPGVLDTENCLACPSATASPEAAHAAFIREGDLFAKHGIVFKKTFISLTEPALAARQLAEDWEAEIGVTEDESNRAVRAGLDALDDFSRRLREKGREVLDMLEREDRIGLVLLGRPYHNDPGINHGLCEELQKRGFPILTQDSLPMDLDTLDEVFGNDIEAGRIPHGLSIADVWKRSFSENSSRKVWAAKFAARHPNLAALELSSFKCGHDAPIYGVIERIVEESGTPFFYFRDIDENRPGGSFRIRIETIAYFLERYLEERRAERSVHEEIEAEVRRYEEKLRRLAEEDDGVSVA